MESTLFTAFRLPVTTSSLASYNFITCHLQLHRLPLSTSSLGPYNLITYPLLLIIYARAREMAKRCFHLSHNTQRQLLLAQAIWKVRTFTIHPTPSVPTY